MNRCFVAIDFETADYGRDSACAIGLVRVEGLRIVARASRLIRPPRRDFMFTYIHGISWGDVAGEPTFGHVWCDLQSLLVGAEFLAAHNASFDRSVLSACCANARIAVPEVGFVCSMKLARSTWDLYPTKLPDVCDHLGLSLNHHDAASDAEACAEIVLAAHRDGCDLATFKTQAVTRPRGTKRSPRQRSAATGYSWTGRTRL